MLICSRACLVIFDIDSTLVSEYFSTSQRVLVTQLNLVGDPLSFAW